MSIKLMQLVWDTSLPMTEKVVLLALADQANDRGVTIPHVRSLAKRCGCSKRTVFEALAFLEARNYLSRAARPGIDTEVQLHPHLWEGRRL